MHLQKCLRPPFISKEYDISWFQTFAVFWKLYAFFWVTRHTYSPMKLGHCAPKGWHIKLRRRKITQNKAYNNRTFVQWDIHTSIYWKWLTGKQSRHEEKLVSFQSNTTCTLSINKVREFYITGIVHYEFVPTGQTVNQVYCLEVLNRLREKLDGNDQKFFPTTHGSCITTMHLLRQHSLWGSF